MPLPPKPNTNSPSVYKPKCHSFINLLNILSPAFNILIKWSPTFAKRKLSILVSKIETKYIHLTRTYHETNIHFEILWLQRLVGFNFIIPSWCYCPDFVCSTRTPEKPRVVFSNQDYSATHCWEGLEAPEESRVNG